MFDWALPLWRPSCYILPQFHLVHDKAIMLMSTATVLRSGMQVTHVYRRLSLCIAGGEHTIHVFRNTIVDTVVVDRIDNSAQRI